MSDENTDDDSQFDDLDLLDTLDDILKDTIEIIDHLYENNINKGLVLDALKYKLFEVKEGIESRKKICTHAVAPLLVQSLKDFDEQIERLEELRRLKHKKS
ncbi:MAG: hypothetical protein OXG88_03570 [Gammaproteobacteria bacterium]|nr:hypothetical protein [Gammaproteobacteria bacterium]